MSGGTDPARVTRPRLAAVIPTLDEEDQLRRHLPRTIELVDEVVVADGGSADATVGVATALGARVVTGAAGRGRQLNRGAAAATADVLLFLHADTVLTPQAVAALRRALADGFDGGGFLCRFDNPRPIYRLGERIVNLRTRLTRCPLGDQAQFVTREAFASLGGYRDWPLLEDLDLIRRLRKTFRVAVLAPPVVTSARRYEEKGIARTIAINWAIFALFALGVPAERLQRLYR